MKNESISELEQAIKEYNSNVDYFEILKNILLSNSSVSKEKIQSKFIGDSA